MIELPIDAEGADRFEGAMIVLVDEGTASAAEIVASALQFHDRATVVGQPTFGKGSVQRVYDFEHGESLRLTVAEWFTPGGDRLQGRGVVCDAVARGAEIRRQEGALPDLLDRRPADGPPGPLDDELRPAIQRRDRRKL